MGQRHFVEDNTSSTGQEQGQLNIKVTYTFGRFLIKYINVQVADANHGVDFNKTFSRDIKDYQVYLRAGSFDERYLEIFVRRVRAILRET